jgi:thymidylate synthase
MNKLDRDYQALLQDILDNGVVKKDRTGTGTKSVFGRQIRHKMSDGFPLLTTKKMAWKPMVIELLWFLQGDTNIQYLVKNGCHIWDGDAYKKYEKYVSNLNDPDIEILDKKDFADRIKNDDEFAKKWGDLGPIYGKQWRKWDSCAYEGEIRVFSQIDQIQQLINDLKNNPDGRRLMVTAWNPSDIPNQVLPPCHYGFQCYTRELTDEEIFELADKKRWELVYDESSTEPV